MVQTLTLRKPRCTITPVQWRKPIPGKEYIVVGYDPLGKAHDLGSFKTKAEATATEDEWNRSFQDPR